MWLNFIVLTIASLCVGFILGWVVARPRRWGVFAADALGTPDIAGGDDPAGVDSSFARRA
jgi:hypothetical protein